MFPPSWFVVLLGLLAASSAAALAEPTTLLRVIASSETGWPQWRGPRRDGICDETGLLQSWPAAGPALLWRTNGIGNGYSAPISTGGRIFITGEVEDDLWISALDMAGRPLWRAKNGRAWKGPYPGARASCTFSAGKLYHLNGEGRVACLEAENGREVWAFNVFEQFGGRNITWAISENLLVDGDRLFVTPGGTKALMACLDKNTGAPLWITPPLRLGPPPNAALDRLPEPVGEVDNCSYGSPLLVALGDRRLVVGTSLRHVFCVDAASGELLWTRLMPTRYSVIAATPLLLKDAILVTAPDTPDGGKLFRFQASAGGVSVTTAWKTPLDTCHGGTVFSGEGIFGSWYRNRKGWACIDPETGRVRYETAELAQGSVLCADQRLYCLSQEGEMALMKAGPGGFEMAGRFRLVPERKSDAWTHPVILDGRLYLRYHDSLYCYDIRAK